MVNGYSGNNSNLAELTLSSEASDLVGQYKGIIRDLDKEIKSCKEQIKELNVNNANLTSKIVQLELTNSQLADQNILLKAQLTASSSTNGQHQINEQPSQVELQNEIQILKIRLNDERQESANEIEKLKKDQEDLLELLNDQESKINKYKNQLRKAGLPVDDDESDELEDGVSIL